MGNVAGGINGGENQWPGVPLSQGSLISAFLYGAALGLLIYGVYDFTCVAIFKD